MIYKKSKEDELDIKLFENPTSEYRSAPFWGWNCELDEEELIRQIDIFKEMGFGGFHIHPRSGMATEYLGEKYMDLVKKCMEKAKKEDMLTWLYDEDRWASGSAGGYVTGIKKYRQRLLLFTVNKKNDAQNMDEAIENGKPYLLKIFDVVLNEDGTLKKYKSITDSGRCEGKKWYVYSANPKELGWYNNNTYLDTLNPEAIDKFIEVTHEAYYKNVGEEFGKNIPAIFTDEPAHSDLNQLPFSFSDDDTALSWTGNFDETFLKEYGFDILEKLPELLWNLENDEVSYARYCYHNHLTDIFSSTFIGKMGAWCNNHNIMLTGHMAEEDSLIMQTRLVGEEMRAYQYFDMPGVDMLCDSTHLTTLKQTASVVHQYAKEGMMAEHCGVTNWDFDFKGHKRHTDMLMALGVTARAHHGSWVSAKSVAKRDYPASINYHSPWYKEYSYVENHAARLAAVLTRGKPVVKVGVIHPIESMWLLFGAQDRNYEKQRALEDSFQNITKALLFGNVDFDFISEALLENIYGGSDEGSFSVGDMKYSAVVVPSCITLRRSTYEKLKEFVKNGGKLIFWGNCPENINAKPSDELKPLYEKSVCVSQNEAELIRTLKEEQDVFITEKSGKKTDNLVYALRKDGEAFWLFIAHAKKRADFGKAQNIVISIKGEYKPVLYDTVNGKVCKISYTLKNGKTYIERELFEHDSLLFKLEKSNDSELIVKKEEKEVLRLFRINEKVSYKREEDNVLLLDMAEMSEDGITYSERDEIRRIDAFLCKKYNYPKTDGTDIQPWAVQSRGHAHDIYLKFTFFAECEVKNAYLAAEEILSAELCENSVDLTDCGWYFDKSLRKYRLPEISKGENTLIAKVPFGKCVSLENMFILGDFDVKNEGSVNKIIEKNEKIASGSLVHQGMPFYGGNITYIAETVCPGGDIKIKLPHFSGALISVKVDGVEKGKIAYSPYEITVENVKKGTHTFEFTLYGNRYNTFASLHNMGNMIWAGPNMWYPEENDWCCEYNLKDMGIMKSPIFIFLK